MSDYVLSCCSPVDLTPEWLDRRDVHYIYFNFQLGSTPMKDDFGVTVPPAELYRRMLAGEDAKTSQVSIGDYIEFFSKFLAEGKDVIHATLSSGISGTYESAVAAAAQLAPKYPDQKLTIIDSMAASAGYGLFVETLADLRDEGMEYDELVAWARSHRKELQHWFFSTDLKFFVRGGRVSKAAGLIGGALNICPLLNVDYEGKLAVREKIRTKRRAIEASLAKMEKHAQDGLAYSGKCFISNSECREDAQALADLIEERFPHLNGKVELFNIGSTIGCHTGPGTVALFFWGDERVD
ncbi:MAG: DegV family protein [Atopobiaceae bacterium]|nr:DegV family protein [Atopobiaceae bacterium]